MPNEEFGIVGHYGLFLLYDFVEEDEGRDGNYATITGTFKDFWKQLEKIVSLATPTGIEPVISSVTGRHVNHYTTGPLILSGSDYT